MVQVRHISGQHVKEFKDFLARYPEEFVVKEEIVFLKEYEGKITSTFREPEEHRIDPVVTNQFIQFFRETVDARGPLHVDQLFELVSNHFNIDLWSTLFKTPQDLLTFLKIYSHLFHVQASIITLVPQKPYTTNQPAVRPIQGVNQTQQPSNHLIGQTSNQSGTPQPINQNLVQRREVGREGGESPRLSSSPNGSCSPRDSPVSLNQQTLKQRVNMVVMRMIAQNSDHDQRVSPREETGGRGEPRPPGQPYQPPHMQVAGGQQGNGESREAVKQRVLGVSRVVVSARESAAIVEELLRAGQPVGFDGEGVNLGPKGQLTLVQISTVGGQVVIII